MPRINAMTAANPADQPAAEPHFGDLRKGAWLKRRADYLLHLDSAQLPACPMPGRTASTKSGGH